MSNNFREVLYKEFIRKEQEQNEMNEESEDVKLPKDDTSIKYSVIDGKVSEPNLIINIDEENIDSLEHLATILLNIKKEEFLPQVLMYIENGLRQKGREEDFIRLIQYIETKKNEERIKTNRPVITPEELGEAGIKFECVPPHNPHPKRMIWEKYENVVEKQIEVSRRIKNSLFTQNDEEKDLFAPYKDSTERAIEDLTSEANEGEDDSMFVPSSLMSDIRMITIFDSWICYTNFDITKEVANRINSFTGVELFKVLTRYRFLLSVSKAFDFEEFRKDFNKELGIQNEQSE